MELRLEPNHLASEFLSLGTTETLAEPKVNLTRTRPGSDLAWAGDELMKAEVRSAQRCGSSEPTGLRNSGTQPLPPGQQGWRRKGVTALRPGAMRRDSRWKKEVEQKSGSLPCWLYPVWMRGSLLATEEGREGKVGGRGCENQLFQGTTEQL